MTAVREARRAHSVASEAMATTATKPGSVLPTHNLVADEALPAPGFRGRKVGSGCVNDVTSRRVRRWRPRPSLQPTAWRCKDRLEM